MCHDVIEYHHIDAGGGANDGVVLIVKVEQRRDAKIWIVRFILLDVFP